MIEFLGEAARRERVEKRKRKAIEKALGNSARAMEIEELKEEARALFKKLEECERRLSDG